MARKPKTALFDGQFWFAIGYAAELLRTSTQKVEALALRGDLRSREEGGCVWIAEDRVTALRRDETERKKLLGSVKLVRPPRRPEIGSSNARLGSAEREDQHVLPISDHRLPLRRQ